MTARDISTDGGPACLGSRKLLDGKVGLAKQQGKRVAHRLSKWPTDMEIDGTGLDQCEFQLTYTFFWC